MSAVQVSHPIWDQAWQMVETRKPAADMLFVYAVRTTGIYCRPSCPSRRPLRASVEFFATSELAERAGYRACKRCAPGQTHPQAHMLTQACDYIEQHLDNTVKLDRLGKLVGLSAFHTQRLFRRFLGISPRQYQQSRRMEHFRQNLITNDSVTTAMYDAGFASSSRLYESTNEHLGMTPTEYRRGGKDVEIRYAIADSPLGKMLVAATKTASALWPLDRWRANWKTIFRRGSRNRREYAMSRTWDDGEAGVGADDGASCCTGAPARCARDRFPTACMGGAATHSPRRDAHLFADCTGDRPTDCCSRGSPRLRDEPCSGGGSMPSRDRQRRQINWVSVGRRTKEEAARVRKASIS